MVLASESSGRITGRLIESPVVTVTGTRCVKKPGAETSTINSPALTVAEKDPSRLVARVTSACPGDSIFIAAAPMGELSEALVTTPESNPEDSCPIRSVMKTGNRRGIRIVSFKFMIHHLLKIAD